MSGIIADREWIVKRYEKIFYYFWIGDVQPKPQSKVKLSSHIATSAKMI